MKLIIGLGNPDKQYQKTWHNLGFLTLDYFQQEYDFGNFKLENKFKSQISTGNIDGDKIILAKPQTYMNNSGQAVGLIIKYFKT
ncbi:MAG TPA: aminoacyl-tRNA hydrolase, partial [Patescibacteria group bacterium]|nr:aminoacyl-tRNA hydrolase [Patescibacteria group bacterium]